MSKKSGISKNIKKRAYNKGIKEGVKSTARDIRKAGEAKDAASAETKLGEILPKIDRAARKGVMHKNTAARKKSKLTKKVNALKASSSKS